ncbi:MAG: hypothetical protein EPN22_08770 [Nitrospirae bacterium]|nr:MAG: hypothetical protein EPN22_08770 [Nitrospirota bacterium]
MNWPVAIDWPIVVDLTKNLAWPIVVLIAIYTFRDSVSFFIRNLKGVKVKKDWLVLTTMDDPALNESLKNMKALRGKNKTPAKIQSMEHDIEKLIAEHMKATIKPTNNEDENEN